MSHAAASIRSMTALDIPSVIKIDRDIHDSSWTEEWFYRVLEAPYRTYVMEQDYQVIGFAVMRYLFEESELLNIGIEKNKQGQGYGKQLLCYLIEQVGQNQIKYIFLEVRSSNQVARRLYKKCGFKEINVRKAYYQWPQIEDAVIYRLNL